MTKTLWVKEHLFEDVKTDYLVDDVLFEMQTDFQSLRIVQSRRFGRMLLLDDVVQTTEKDEFAYHEMMTHVPMLAHVDAQRVLIIGGGDGGILREVLKHPGVKRAVMVEIDQAVIDLSKQYLPTISDGAFDDPRAEIVIADGAQYVQSTTERFDVVIVDSPDPIGPAKVLFTQAFYTGIRALQTEQGIMVRQTGSTIMQPEEQQDALRVLSGIYPINRPYIFSVPTYVGGLFSAIFASLNIDPLTMEENLIEQKCAALALETRYHNAGIQHACFRVPQYMKGQDQK